MIILGELIKIRGSDNYSDTGGPPGKGELEGVSLFLYCQQLYFKS